MLPWRKNLGLLFVALFIVGMFTVFNPVNQVQAGPSLPSQLSYVAPFHVSGNQILDANNNPVKLKGIARMGEGYDPSFTSRETNPTYYNEDFGLMEGWGVNFIRQTFNLYSYNTSASYRTAIANVVKNETAHGFYVLLDDHGYTASLANPDGLWTNNNTITNTDYDIEGETALAWSQRVLFPTLRAVAKDFNSTQYNNVIGLEINEYWPDSNRTMNWLVDKSIIQHLADTIHITAHCPKYLIFFIVGFIDTHDFSTSNFKVGTSDNQKIVYAIHFYIDPTYSPWSSDFLSYYQAGDYATGKSHMYSYLNQYMLPVFTAHNVPVVFDEIGCDDSYGKGLDDMLSYFDTHGYGYNYWAWYGTSAASPQMCMLWGDWVSIRDNTYWLIKHLNYKHFFQWQNAPLTLNETYNWNTNTTTDFITYPSYASVVKYFGDGFESGTFSAWSGTDVGGSNHISVQSTTKYSGTYAENCSIQTAGQSCCAYKDLGASYSTIYVTAYFRVSALPPSNNEILFIGLGNGGNGPWALGISNQGGTIEGAIVRTKDAWSWGGEETYFSLGTTLQTNTWYCYGLYIVLSPTSGSCTVYLNGNKVWFEAESDNTALGSTFSRLYSGVIGGWFGGQYTTKLFMDDINVYNTAPQPNSYEVQFYALNVTAHTQVSLSNGTTFNALPYWNSGTKLITFQIDPAEMSITISDSTLTSTTSSSSTTTSSSSTTTTSTTSTSSTSATLTSTTSSSTSKTSTTASSLTSVSTTSTATTSTTSGNNKYLVTMDVNQSIYSSALSVNSSNLALLFIGQGSSVFGVALTSYSIPKRRRKGLPFIIMSACILSVMVGAGIFAMLQYNYSMSPIVTVRSSPIQFLKGLNNTATIGSNGTWARMNTTMVGGTPSDYPSAMEIKNVDGKSHQIYIALEPNPINLGIAQNVTIKIITDTGTQIDVIKIYQGQVQQTTSQWITINAGSSFTIRVTLQSYVNASPAEMYLKLTLAIE